MRPAKPHSVVPRAGVAFGESGLFVCWPFIFSDASTEAWFSWYWQSGALTIAPILVPGGFALGATCEKGESGNRLSIEYMANGTALCGFSCLQSDREKGWFSSCTAATEDSEPAELIVVGFKGLFTSRHEIWSRATVGSEGVGT